MALDAGSVYATLGGRVAPGGFEEFEGKMKGAAAAAERFETTITAAMRRMEASTTAAASKAADAEKAQADAAADSAARIQTANRTMADSTTAAATKIRAASDAIGKSMTGGTTKASKSTQQWSKINKQASDSLDQMGHAAKLAAGGGLLAVAAGAAVAVTQAVSFQRQLHNINSLAGLSEKGLQGISRELLAMAGEVGQSPRTLADGMYQLVSSGFNARDAMVVLRASAIAATAGLTDTGTAATAISGAINAYGLRARDAGHVSDVLFQTVNRGVVSFEQLAQGIGPVLPFAAKLGIGLDQVGASVATLTKQGIPAAEAFTALRGAMSTFINDPRDFAAAVKQTGYESGTALIRARGFQGALEALAGTTRGNSTAFKRLFPDVRAATAAFDLTGRSARMADGDVKAFSNTAVRGAASKVFAEQSRSNAVQLQKLGAAAQSVAIDIGNYVLPQLAKLGQQGAQAIGKFLRSGDAADVGHALSEAFSTIGHVVSDVAPDIEAVAKALLDVGRALDIGSASHIEALLATFLGFKAAEAVLPIILSLGGAIGALATAAYTAPSLGAFFGDVVDMANPITLVAAGVGALAGALVLLSGNEHSEAEAAADVTAAKKDELTAIQAVHDAVLGAANSTFAARDADIALTRARQTLSDVTKKYGKNSPQYRQALEDEREAALRSTTEHQQLTRAKQDMTAADLRAQQAATKTIAQARQLRDQRISDATKEFMDPSGTHDQARLTDEVNDAWRRYNATVQQAARGTDAATISQINLDRVLNGQRLVTDAQATSVANLTRVWDSLPRKTRLELATTSGPAVAQIGDLVGRLKSLPRQQVVRILTDASTAREQIAALNAAVHGVPTSRIVKIETSSEPERVKVLQLTAAVHGVPQRVVAKITSTASTESERVAALTAAIHGVPESRILKITSSAASERLKVAELSAAIHGVPQSVVSHITSSAASERVKVTALTAAIDGVPPSKVSQIVADGAVGATAQVAALNDQINAVHSTSATITVTEIHNTVNTITDNVNRLMGQIGGKPKAAGRGPSAGEVALIGEGAAPEYRVDAATGRGYKTSGPHVAALGPSEYVIPTERRYRSGASVLFDSLARDLGVPGYASGRPRATAAGSKKKAAAKVKPSARYGSVPKKIALGGVDYQDVRTAYDSAEEGYKRAVDAERTAKTNVARAKQSLASAQHEGYRVTRGPNKGRWSNQTTRDNAAKRVKDTETLYDRAKKVTAERRPGEVRRKAEYQAAKRYYDKISNARTDVDAFTQAMADADSRYDDRAYLAAQKGRISKLKFLIRTEQEAYKLADPNSDYARGLLADLIQWGGRPAADGRTSGFGGDVLAAQAPVDTAPEPDETDAQRRADQDADDEASTGMTAAERGTLAQINANVALAALTPDTGDDITAAQQLVNFLGSVLPEVESDPARGGAAEVADIAGQLRTARDNLDALVNPNGSSTNSDPDLQAQLDQANQRLVAQQAETRAANNALAVFGGSGDIGAGGGSSVTQNIYTLHPGDPATLTAIGQAATAGIGYQGSRRAVGIKPGI